MHLIDLTRADTQPLEFAERVQLAAETCGEDVVQVGELCLEGVIARTSRGYHLGGQLTGEVVLMCVRCLGEFALPLAEEFEIELLPVAAAPREEETRLERDELDVVFFSSLELDLAAIASEQVQLAVPMKPLCQEGCKGLCPRCGHNLNQGACSCAPAVDARWEPLLSWRPAQ